MDELKLVCTSSDENGAQEVRNQVNSFPVLHNEIVQLLCTRLSDHSIMVMQEELQLMQRSSYYLDIHRSELLPTTDEQQHMHLSDSTVWSLIDQQRLQHTMTLANTQVKLLLTLLGLLYQEIIRGCRELETFIKYDQGLVDCDMAASMQQKLQQTHQYVKSFEKRITRNLGTLSLQHQLILNTGTFSIPQLSASLAIKMPVIFDRFESCATSDSVYLCWEVESEQAMKPNQEFEIHVKSLPSTSNENDQFFKYICQSYNLHVRNLLSDRYYQFSVKRVDAVNLVYGLWIDTIILKTLDI